MIMSLNSLSSLKTLKIYMVMEKWQQKITIFIYRYAWEATIDEKGLHYENWISSSKMQKQVIFSLQEALKQDPSSMNFLRSIFWRGILNLPNSNRFVCAHSTVRRLISKTFSQNISLNVGVDSTMSGSFSLSWLLRKFLSFSKFKNWGSGGGSDFNGFLWSSMDDPSIFHSTLDGNSGEIFIPVPPGRSTTRSFWSLRMTGKLCKFLQPQRSIFSRFKASESSLTSRSFWECRRFILFSILRFWAKRKHSWKLNG